VETETALTTEVTENTEKKTIMEETTEDRSKGLNASSHTATVALLLVSVALISISLLFFSVISVTSVVNVFVVGV
jgi:hypothetical protein